MTFREITSAVDATEDNDDKFSTSNNNKIHHLKPSPYSALIYVRKIMTQLDAKDLQSSLLRKKLIGSLSRLEK